MTEKTKTLRAIALAVFISLLLFGGIFVGLGIWMGPPKVTKDVGRLPAVLADWAPSGLVAHFPSIVPADATDVRFTAYPGYLQDFAYVQLRMRLPTDRVAAIESALKPVAKHVYVGGDLFTHYNADPTNNTPTAMFRTADAPEVAAFRPTHTLYLLHAKTSDIWNHGQTYGVAVSMEQSEVIYFAESW